MTLNVSGPISLAGVTAGESIQIELGGNGSTQMGLNDSNVRALAVVPTGQITMPTDFYGKSNLTATISNYAPNFNKIINNGSIWLAAHYSENSGDNNVSIYRSTDGVTWTPLDMTQFTIGVPTPTSSPLGGIFYANNQFIVLTNEWNGTTTVGYTYTSSDGLTWTLAGSGSGTTGLISSPINIAWNGSVYLAVYSGSFRYSSNLITWTSYSFTGTTYSLIFDGTFFIVSGTYGVSISTSGTSSASFVNFLSITSGPTNWRCRFVGYGGGNYITTNGETVYTSPNLSSWTIVGSLPTSNYGYSVTWDNSTSSWLIGGLDFGTTTGTAKIFRSTNNGVSWTTVLSELEYVAIRSIASISNKIVAGGNNSLLYSTNGTSWTNQLTGYINLNPSCALYANSTYFVGGSYISGSTYYKAIYSSSDAINWTMVASFALSNTLSSSLTTVRGIAVNGTNYVALCNDYSVLTSSNGTTWTNNAGVLPSLIGSLVPNFTDIAYNSHTGYYAVVGWSGLVFTSTDGLTWTQRTATPSAQWSQIRFLNYYFYGVSGGNNYLVSDSFTWAVSQPSGLIVGNWASASYDGANYIMWSSFASSSAPNVLWQNGNFTSAGWNQLPSWSVSQVADYGTLKYIAGNYSDIYYSVSLSSPQAKLRLPRKGSYSDIAANGPKTLLVGSPKMIVVVQ